LREYADILTVAARENEATALMRQADELTAQYEELKERWLEVRRIFEETPPVND